MPGGDGKGPLNSGTRGGKMGGPYNAGPGGYCLCPKCGTKAEHRRAEPCNSIKCPKCGTLMTRA
jgi:uncharacterized paraquat-inducible protein A